MREPLTADELRALCARLTQRTVALEDRARMLEAQYSGAVAQTGGLRDENRALHRLLLKEAVRHEQGGRKDQARALMHALADIRAGTVPALAITEGGQDREYDGRAGAAGG